MFRYGRTNGYLTILLIVLSILPLLEAFFTIPQLPDMVAMAFGAGGEPTRFASRYQLFLVPGICVLLAAGMILTGRRQADASIDKSRVAAELSYRRSMRSALIMVVLLNACNIYMLVTAFLGKGFSFAL